MNNRRPDELGDYRIIRIGNTFNVQRYSRKHNIFRQWKTYSTCRDFKKARSEVVKFKELDKENNKEVVVIWSEGCSRPLCDKPSGTQAAPSRS